MLLESRSAFYFRRANKEATKYALHSRNKLRSWYFINETRLLIFKELWRRGSGTLSPYNPAMKYLLPGVVLHSSSSPLQLQKAGNAQNRNWNYTIAERCMMN